jgi:hypothetical protein
LNRGEVRTLLVILFGIPAVDCSAQTHHGNQLPPPRLFIEWSSSPLSVPPVPTATQAREPGAGKIILQLAAGVAGAWLGGLAGYQLVAGIADDRTVKGDAGYSPAGNGGFVIGSALGSATASALVGWALRTDGSFPGALAGASVPSLLLLLGLDEPYLGLIGAIFVAPLQSGGAYLGWRSLF